MMTKNEKDLIIQLYTEEHLSINKVAKQIGRDWSTVKNFLNQSGVKQRKYNCKISKTEDIAKVIKMYGEGETTENIGKEMGVSDRTIAKILEQNNVKIRDKGVPSNIVSHDYFSKIDTPNKAYVLGFLLADGSIGNTKSSKNRIAISQNDINKQVLEDIALELCGDVVNISSYQHKRDKNGNNLTTHSFAVHSKQACADLAQLGIVPNKTLIASIPVIKNKSLYPHLIRGIFDGDGTVYIDKNKQLHFGFYGTYDVVSSVQDILIQAIGISDNKITTQRGANVSFSSYAKRQDILNFYNYIYPSGSYICLLRKREIFHKWLSNCK